MFNPEILIGFGMISSIRSSHPSHFLFWICICHSTHLHFSSTHTHIYVYIYIYTLYVGVYIYICTVWGWPTNWYSHKHTPHTQCLKLKGSIFSYSNLLRCEMHLFMFRNGNEHLSYFITSLFTVHSLLHSSSQFVCLFYSYSKSQN